MALARGGAAQAVLDRRHHHHLDRAAGLKPLARALVTDGKARPSSWRDRLDRSPGRAARAAALVGAAYALLDLARRRPGPPRGSPACAAGPLCYPVPLARLGLAAESRIPP